LVQILQTLLLKTTGFTISILPTLMPMKAAVLYETGELLVIEDQIDLPSLAPGQALVKMAYSGVCHSQLMEVSGKKGKDDFIPHLLGHEGSGKVVENGRGVTKIQPGDNVILGWIKGDGLDDPRSQYRKGQIVINSEAVTTFNEYAVVSENRVVKLPEGVPMDIAVLFGCALLKGVGMVINEIKPEKGSNIAFLGLGGIGLSALMASQLFECDHVIAIYVETKKLDHAKRFGSTNVINSRNGNAAELIFDLTAGARVDYCVESAGSVRTIELGIELIRKNGGLCLFASHPKSGEKIQIEPHDLISGKQLKGSWGGSSYPDRDIPKLAELYLNGKLPLDELLSPAYSLNHINPAISDLENKKINRGLIDFSL
jgi:S-(hydroxymethyl)glutathione dehydrogenase / alcohol dehydrogenase